VDDRQFDLDAIPEVPLIRPARVSRGAPISDERLDHGYPPDWNRCTTCNGDGKGWGELVPVAIATSPELPMPRMVGRDEEVQAVWLVTPRDRPSFEVTATARGQEGLDRLRFGGASKVGIYRGWRPRDGKCPDCLGMGSVKARVRLEAGHRCIRCGHPYMPKHDARMLGVEPSPYHWSPCDEHCTHGGPVRALLDETFEVFDGPYNVPGVISAGVPVEAEWRILTVHHLTGDKADCRWGNLVALCQRCHLYIQSKVVMERVYPHEHADWFKPHAAWWYALTYLNEDLSREEVMARLDELLALERA
jgi:hypothetical protein